MVFEHQPHTLGCALAAKRFDLQGRRARFSFRSLEQLNDFTRTSRLCRASCEHEHRCNLDVIRFADGQTILYGDRCGRYSALDQMGTTAPLAPHLPSRASGFMYLNAALQGSARAR